MTITEFMERFNLTNERTVIDWINKDLILGVRKKPENGDWIIPERAWPPYTKARAKNVNSIYKSIVTACNERRYPLAKLYKINEKEFSFYIEQLVKAEIITTDEEDGFLYYHVTPKSDDFLKSKSPAKYLENAILKLSEATVQGAVSAVIKSIT